MVRELFNLARSKKACIIFFDEVDAIGGSRTAADDTNSDNEVQRTMLQIVTELDGFDPRGNIKVLMATNRPDTLDPALLRPGRLDRKVRLAPALTQFLFNVLYEMWRRLSSGCLILKAAPTLCASMPK
jgi:ATP-dependent 26S proteasome regulatory subunit